MNLFELDLNYWNLMRSIYNGIILILIFVIASCNGNLKIIKSEVKITTEHYVDELDAYPKMLSELRNSISKKELPNFIFDECLHCKCHISILSSESRIDCFESMLDSLNYTEMTFLATTKDSAMLMKYCMDEKSCRNKEDLLRTTWGSIQYVFKKKTLIKNLSNYYSHSAIYNQSGVDTSSFYANYSVTYNGARSYTIYKFFSDGTYKRFQTMDGWASLDLQSNFSETGRYYVSGNNRQMTLERIYPNSDYSDVIKDKLTFIIKKRGIDLISRYSGSVSETFYYKKAIYRRYKSIVFE